MIFTIFYDKHPRKFLKKLDTHIAKRLIDKIDEILPHNPVPHDAKSIIGKHGVFRIRIGDYRAVYRIDYKQHNIIIFVLDKRGRVFE